jgi:uncharacterized protein
MDFRVSVLGLIVGFLVGVTGTGGGALLTPLLILLGWAPPMIAVGTDLVWSTLTKSAGAVVHWRQQTVDMTMVKRLALGSIPGALLGLSLLAHFHASRTHNLDRLILRMLGVALVVVACSLFWRALRGARPTPTDLNQGEGRRRAWLTTLTGLVVGFLVSITSVGSGSLIIASLVVLYPGTPLRRMVGSDIVHALLLVGVSALGHLRMGSIDTHLLGALLVGSIPGVWLGSRMTARVPEKALRPVLGTALLLLGCKLL